MILRFVKHSQRLSTGQHSISVCTDTRDSAARMWGSTRDMDFVGRLHKTDPIATLPKIDSTNDAPPPFPTMTSPEVPLQHLSQQDKRDSMSERDSKAQVTLDALAEDGPRKPEWLCNISEDELALRNKKLVRKMDMVIL